MSVTQSHLTGIRIQLLARARAEKFRFSDEFFYRLVKMYGNVANHPQKAICGVSLEHAMICYSHE
jgi:hypothetical protein